MADLRPYIYHEVQDRNGSMLCAQHCLNNLLQQHLYSEFDLADLAANLDAQENAELDDLDRRETSQNMDDTGFFSLSVLENALQVFDLTLVRWRGEEMRRFHDHPEWYNLNSFLPQPDWISPTYLQMVLAEAENEGYSVFVVRKLSEIDGAGACGGEESNGTQGLGVLPECQAEMIALELGDPAGRSGAGMENMLGNVTTNPARDNGTYASAARSAQPHASGSGTPSRFDLAPVATASSSSSFEELDPVAASLARSKADLARFQQEQTSALFESQAYNPPQARRRRQGDVPDIFSGNGDDETVNMAGTTANPPPMNRFQRQRLEEEEMMKQAIEESLRDARARGELVDEDAEPAQTDFLGGSFGSTPVMTSAPISRPLSAAARQEVSSTDSIEAQADEDVDEELDDDLASGPGPAEPAYDFIAQSRYYDDDDAALQAALSASLAEGVPDGWVPPTPKVAVPASEMRVQQPVAASNAHGSNGAVVSAPAAAISAKDNGEEDDTADEEDDDEEEEEEEPAASVLSPEELRRKRLERFK